MPLCNNSVISTDNFTVGLYGYPLTPESQWKYPNNLTVTSSPGGGAVWVNSLNRLRLTGSGTFVSGVYTYSTGPNSIALLGIYNTTVYTKGIAA